MQIQLIRSATLKITIAGHTFIIDPTLAPRHSMPSYTGTSPNPLVDLPFAPEKVLEGCEMAVISHLHSDHFDKAAQQLLSKTIPLVCQPDDTEKLRKMHFTILLPVLDSLVWNDIDITRTPAQHGSGAVLAEMGEASGFVFETKGEPSLYWTGDTIWTPKIGEVIKRFQPDVIVTHSGGAEWGDNVPIIMNAEQTIALCQAAPGSVVIATHMEALDHCTVDRIMLRSTADINDVLPTQLIIPADGEVIHLN